MDWALGKRREMSLSQHAARLFCVLMECGLLTTGIWEWWHNDYNSAILLAVFAVYFSVEGWGIKLAATAERGK